jgi:hypothetical protein
MNNIAIIATIEAVAPSTKLLSGKRIKRFINKPFMSLVPHYL